MLTNSGTEIQNNTSMYGEMDLMTTNPFRDYPKSKKKINKFLFWPTEHHFTDYFLAVYES